MTNPDRVLGAYEVSCDSIAGRDEPRGGTCTDSFAKNFTYTHRALDRETRCNGGDGHAGTDSGS